MPSIRESSSASAKLARRPPCTAADQVVCQAGLPSPLRASAPALPAGDYRIHYLLADQYDSAGYVAVTVE